MKKKYTNLRHWHATAYRVHRYIQRQRVLQHSRLWRFSASGFGNDTAADAADAAVVYFTKCTLT